MKNHLLRLPRLSLVSFIVASGVVVPLSPVLRGQAEGALLTRHGALIQGTVEGSMRTLDEAADVTVDRGSSLVGDLVLPSGKPSAGETADVKRKVSSKAKITIPDMAVLHGRQRISAGFDLPKIGKPHAPTGTQSVTLQTATGNEPDFKKTKDINVNSAKRELAIPPGTYGDLTVTNGRVVLGQKGSIGPVRYDFQSITIRPNGLLDLAGPVVVTVATLGKIQGILGNTVYTNWLDLRVTSGDVVLDNKSEVHGVVTAADNLVTIGKGAKLRGGVVSDRATVEAGGKFTGVQPSWSKESSGNSLPLFIHKAARVAYRAPDLAERYGSDYDIDVAYAMDEPFIIATQKTPAANRPNDLSPPRLFFDACCTLFDGTGFSRGNIMMLSQGTAAARSAPQTIQVAMESGQFEDNLWAIGRQRDPRASIRVIRDNPQLLTLFMARALKVAADVAAKGGVR